MQELQDGSFYQYFESKEDLLCYLLKNHIDDLNDKIEETLIKTNGNIFEVFIQIYEYMINNCESKNEYNFFKNILENIKAIEDNNLIVKMKTCNKCDLYQFYTKINKESLNIKSENDIKLITKMLFIITKRAIMSSFKYESREEAKKDYLKQIEFLKYGILK